MEIEITNTKVEGAERRIQVAVPGATVTEAKKRAARRVAQQVRMPGFRVGKAPTAVVEKKYADVIQQEALEAVMRDAYQAVIEREQLKLVAQPHAHDVKFADDGALSFELHCEVQPDVTLAHVEGFKVKRPVATVTDDHLREQIEQMRDQRATWTPVEEKPAEGDMVVVMLAMADDADGLTDLEEVQGSRFSPGTPTEVNNPDSDGDGMSDGEEAAAETDPTDPNVYLHILNISRAPAGEQITYLARNDKDYIIRSWDGSYSYPTNRLDTQADASGGSGPWQVRTNTYEDASAATNGRYYAIEPMPSGP